MMFHAHIRDTLIQCCHSFAGIAAAAAATVACTVTDTLVRSRCFACQFYRIVNRSKGCSFQM
jgi:p-aminobenzoyl-glutamate transporter AbgT